jgi:hypothetical protein
VRIVVTGRRVTLLSEKYLVEGVVADDRHTGVISRVDGQSSAHGKGPAGGHATRQQCRAGYRLHLAS